MARPPKYPGETTETVSIRFPCSFIESKPKKYKTLGDWIMDIVSNKVQVVEIQKINEHENESPKFEHEAINSEQKQSLQFFYDLFSDLFGKGKLDKVIDEEPELLNYAQKFKEVLA
jgi:hypothetical protein